MGTYGSILSKDADTHGRNKGIPDDRKRRGREIIIVNNMPEKVKGLPEESTIYV